MANLNTSISTNIIESFLPAFGNPKSKGPIWDESQKMFIVNEYSNKAGVRYYAGVRIGHNVVIVERLCQYFSITYINGLELYAFNGEVPELIQKVDFTLKTFRKVEMVRNESERMVKEYLAGVLKSSHATLVESKLDELSKQFVAETYNSFLNADFDMRLTKVLKYIEQ